MLRAVALFVAYAALTPVQSQKTDVERLTCAVDIAQAVLSLSEAANSINAGILVCPDPRETCSAVVSNVIAAMAYVASFASLAIAECGASVNINAFCAADVGSMLNSIALTSRAASGFASGSCSDLKRRLWRRPQHGTEIPGNATGSGDGWGHEPLPNGSSSSEPLPNGSNSSEELGRLRHRPWPGNSSGSERAVNAVGRGGLHPAPRLSRGLRHAPLLKGSIISEELERRRQGPDSSNGSESTGSTAGSGGLHLAPRLGRGHRHELLPKGSDGPGWPGRGQPGPRPNSSEAVGEAARNSSDFDPALWPAYRQYLFLRNSSERFQAVAETMRERELAKWARDTALATCTINSVDVILFLMRAGIIMNGAATDCSPLSLESAGREGQMKCTIGISGFVTALEEAFTFLSELIDACPVENYPEALCATDVLAMTSVFSALVASGTAMPFSCGMVGQAPSPGLAVQTLPNRRLAAAS
mmetsp:Transcript_15354/g.48369  ORF Transcript_15354/g.48369 Transcript_15354/m.48369 type:complete len:474 (+) Transcript_15354:98-1519(+)